MIKIKPIYVYGRVESDQPGEWSKRSLKAGWSTWRMINKAIDHLCWSQIDHLCWSQCWSVVVHPLITLCWSFDHTELTNRPWWSIARINWPHISLYQPLGHLIDHMLLILQVLITLFGWSFHRSTCSSLNRLIIWSLLLSITSLNVFSELHFSLFDIKTKLKMQLFS